MAAPGCLRWDDYARRSSGCFHVARVQFETGRATDPHTHDFAEVFWVERGAATHLIGGEAIFIRPADRHAFTVETGAGITFVNLALPMTILQVIEQRYDWRQAGHWPWRHGAPPEPRQLPADLSTRLPAATARLVAGRSPEHVNRTVRSCLGLTSSQLLNRLRAEHAGRQLRLGDRTIADIAFACGVNHLGYFHKLFHAHFGTMPHRYRQAQRMGMDPAAN